MYREQRMIGAEQNIYEINNTKLIYYSDSNHAPELIHG